MATRPVISAADPLADPHHLSASISITFTPVFTSYLPIVLHTIPRPPCETYRVDDFSNPDSGWPVGYQSDNVYTEYLASEYHVTHSGSGGG
ncbi:MAG: hypothetical protein K8S14_09160, partial [Actinomycetia bacterium]|nr:hypothetical protein [Actinomycetes bacterium]